MTAEQMDKAITNLLKIYEIDKGVKIITKKELLKTCDQTVSSSK